MNHSEGESVENVYDVYYAENGERVVVLEGLDPQDRPHLYPMQEYIQARADRIEFFYWLLLVGVVGYLLVRHIAAPLYHKWTSF